MPLSPDTAQCFPERRLINVRLPLSRLVKAEWKTMGQNFSALARIDDDCRNFVHPYCDSCLEFVALAYIYSIWQSFKVYFWIQGVSMVYGFSIGTWFKRSSFLGGT